LFFGEVDAYLADSFNADVAAPQSIKDGLDKLLAVHRVEGYNNGSSANFIDVPTAANMAT